jgi:DNA-binding NarL/FixJ family response regulator
MIRVIAVEDHHLVRQGICRLLEDAPDIRVVGGTGNGWEAVALIEQLSADVVVLDISMPQLNGIDTLALIRASQSSPRVVMLSMHADAELVKQALRGGALGYVLKQSVADELLAAVRAANAGSIYLSAGVSHLLTGGLLAARPHTLLDRLSPREREVVQRIVAGQSTREIAESLRTSVKTVEKQRRDAMRKLEVDNLASLVRVSLELGLSAERVGSNSSDRL